MKKIKLKAELAWIHAAPEHYPDMTEFAGSGLLAIYTSTIPESMQVDC